MTRPIVYTSALVAFVLATVMTIAAILTPNWVTYRVTASTGITITRSVGLHQACNSVSDPPCRHFPADNECLGDERYFCSMWRSTGFLMNLAPVVELATIVAFLVIMAGGKMKREGGWRIMGGLLGLVGAVQFCALSIVAYLFDHDEKFVVPGWHLDSSWIMCTLSGCIALLIGFGLAISAYALPPEDGYEFLHDPLDA